MVNLFKILNTVLGIALPLGDDLDTNKRYSAIPMVGSKSSKSYFQRELEDAHREGKWIPKILLLPNVGKFEIKLNNYKPAPLANGILTREQSSVTLYQNRNRKMNRYLVYCY